MLRERKNFSWADLDSYFLKPTLIFSKSKQVGLEAFVQHRKTEQQFAGLLSGIDRNDWKVVNASKNF